MWRRPIPVEILDAIWTAVVLVGSIVLWGHLPFQGALFLFAVGAYGTGRIVLESLRDEQERIRGVSVHRLISTGLIAASLGATAIGWWRY